MLNPLQKFVVSAALFGSATLTVAEEVTSPQETSADPLPKGYDESFNTGDIPKANTPEMDPDATAQDELAPEISPDTSSLTSSELEIKPGELLVGASASLAFPHVINLAIESMVFQKFGFSINYGSINRNLNGVDASIKHTDIRFRWFPWNTSFFAGLGFGHHEVSGELRREIKEPTSKKSITTTGKLAASANFALPHIGWFAVWDSGLSVGFDLGYLIPFGAKSKFTATFSNPPEGTDAALRSTPEFSTMKSDLEDTAEAYASKPLPYVTLVRIGWLF